MRSVQLSFLWLMLLIPKTQASGLEGIVELLVEASKVNRTAPCAAAIIHSVYELPKRVTPLLLLSELEQRSTEGQQKKQELLMRLNPSGEKSRDTSQGVHAAFGNGLSEAETKILISRLQATKGTKEMALHFSGAAEITGLLNSIHCEAMAASRRMDIGPVCARAAGGVAVIGGIVTAFLAAKTAQFGVMMDVPSPLENLFGIKPAKPDFSRENQMALYGLLSMGGGMLSYLSSYFMIQPGETAWTSFYESVSETLIQGNGVRSSELQFFTVSNKKQAVDVILYEEKGPQLLLIWQGT